MKKKIITLLSLLIGFYGFAQSFGEIKGKVVELGTNTPVPFANVYVEFAGSPIGTVTDMAGKFTLKPINPGIYDLTISFVGYTDQVIQEVRVSKDNTTYFDKIELVYGITKDAFVVKWQEPLVDKGNVSQIKLNSAEIERNPQIKNINSMVASSVPGIYQADSNQPLYVRGSRSGSVQYIVDGVKVLEGNIGIPSTAIGELSIYTGGVPAKYGDTMGGVIVVETKSYFSLLNSHDD